MAAPTVTVKTKGPIVDPGLCRCCGSIKKCRLLTVEYMWNGEKEIYSEMFMDCFGLLLSHLDGESKECCICAACVTRLRDACAFRRQVLCSEELFLSRLHSKEEGIVTAITARLDKESAVWLERQQNAFAFRRQVLCSEELFLSRLHSKEEGVESKVEVEVKAEPVCEESDAMDDREDCDAPLPELEPEDTPTKTEPDAPETPERKPKTRSQARDKDKRSGKRDLISKMHKLRTELQHILDLPDPTPPKKEKISKKEKSFLDHDNMVYLNAVTMVQNSYVCPFQNRISNYYCYYCKDQFVNPIELRDHTLAHDPKMFESMMENKKIPKIDIMRIDCRLCQEKIDNIDSLKCHLTTVHGKEIYPVQNEFLKFRLTVNNLTCTECDNSFPYFDMLKKHMIDHFGTYICDVCGACFLEQNSLKTHIKSHNKVEANFPCEICGKNLKSKYSRYLHVATVHEKKPTVNCYKCEASFLSYALRNRHLIEVHGDKRTFPCKLCDKVYNRRKTLMEHNRRNHLKVFRHQCELCDQRFYLPSRLKEHMATHTGERNFRCEFCEKSYPRLQSLQEHIRSHSSERRYKCDLCNSAFTQNGSLKNHMKSHHQGYEIDTSFN